MEHLHPQQVPTLSVDRRGLTKNAKQVLDTAAALKRVTVVEPSTEEGSDVFKVTANDDLKKPALSLLRIRREEGVAVEGLERVTRQPLADTSRDAQRQRLQRMFQ